MASIAPYLTDGPEQRQIILLKLCHELESAPNFPNQYSYAAGSDQRQWLARVGALLERIGIGESVAFSSSLRLIAQHGSQMVEPIKGQMLDAIEKLRLELHLSGRDDFGSVYERGETYKFFSAVVKIISEASRSVFIVDPYLDGDAFRNFIGAAAQNKKVRLLCDRYLDDVRAHSSKFNAQFGDRCEVRSSKEIHDRLIIVDDEDCWLVGASIKDGGRKPTYLIPLSPIVAPRKLAIYNEIWLKSAGA